MSELLPVVQKAQPHYIGASGELYPSKVSNDNWIDYVYKEKDIERERAGYEKREQTLKNKIKELANQLHANTYLEIKEELLGLSKQ